MKGIKGEISSLPITDLMQWIEMNRKTGVLFLKRGKSGPLGKSGQSSGRIICFKDGGILLASSNEDGRRLGDYLMSEAQVPLSRLREIIAESREKGSAFIDDLSMNKLVPLEFMKVVLEHVAESVLVDILSWSEGTFHFVEDLPNFIGSGRVVLNTNHLVFESVRKYDESRRQQGPKGA